MSQFTQEWYNQQLAKRLPTEDRHLTARVLDEGKLHEEILAECRRRGWLVFHGSMAHKSWRTLGEPDFVILLECGRTVMVECKTAAGKLSTDQQAVHAWARKLGHNIYTVRSFEEFLKIL